MTNHHFLDVTKFLQSKEDMLREVKRRITKVSVQSWDKDYGNFMTMFDFFLDNLLCDQNQRIYNDNTFSEISQSQD